MSLLEWANLGGTLLTFDCFSFAVTSFGSKLGRLSGFKNTSGFDYITDSSNSDALFADIVKVYENIEGTPPWAKNKDQLRDRCTRYQRSLRYWNETAKYCLIQNNVRHQLIKNNVKLKEQEGCTDAILNNYSDNTESFAYLLGKKKCEDKTTPPSPTQAPSGSSGTDSNVSTNAAATSSTGNVPAALGESGSSSS